MKFLLALLCTTSSAFAQDLSGIGEGKTVEQLIAHWRSYEIACRADLSGEVTYECLARTEYADELRKRGVCQDVVSGRWGRCLVQ